MKKHFYLFLMGAFLFSLSSCNDKNDDYDDRGSSTIILLESPSTAFMGDSISFSFKVTSGGGIPLNISKAQILYGDNVVSERIMVTGEAGDYSGKIFIPFLKDIPDGNAIVKLRIQNERFTPDVATNDITVTRPEFPYLTLKTADKDYRMEPVSGSKHTYAVTDDFPSEVLAYIIAPKYGENGNVITFGAVDGKIQNGVNNDIEFTAKMAGEYEIAFNTLSYVGSPFIPFSVNNVEFEKVNDNEFKVEMTFTQGQEVVVSGLKADYENYWIDPAFFDIKKNTDKQILVFRGMTAKYRFTVNKLLKYFNVELMNGNELSVIGNGEGAIWVIGNNDIGKPSYSKNGINWGVSKGFCLTPIGGGKHQMILKAGETISSTSINFKFFGQKDWGFEFTSSRISLIEGGNWIRVNGGSSDDGNIMKVGDLTKDKYYVFTVDVSKGINSATLSLIEQDNIEEVD